MQFVYIQKTKFPQGLSRSAYAQQSRMPAPMHFTQLHSWHDTPPWNRLHLAYSLILQTCEGAAHVPTLPTETEELASPSLSRLCRYLENTGIKEP